MLKKPKTKPKTYPKNKRKVEPEHVNITSRKSYWIFLTLVMVIFGSVYGLYMKIAVAAIAILLSSVLSILAFAFYLKFNASTLTNRIRAAFIFAGASIVGFSIWAATLLSLSAAGLNTQIDTAMGYEFFAVTTQIICVITGAFIGELIGKNKESIQRSLRRIGNTIFRLENNKGITEKNKV